MTPEQYGDGDWTIGELAAAKALWDSHNPHLPWQTLHPSIADAWMIYLKDARVVFNAAIAALPAAPE
jgi:hypothetical protein